MHNRRLERSRRCRVFVALATLLLTSAAQADADPSGAPERPESTSIYTKRGVLGAVRAGPTVGVGAPDGARFGAFAKWRGLLAGGMALSLLPQTTVPGTSAQVTRVSGEAFGRVHPFHGAFFMGVAGGYAQTKGAVAEQATAFRQTQRVETHAYANAVFVAPHLGFQWMLPHGITVGFDAGVEIPVLANGPTFDAAKYGLVVPIEGKGSVADATRYMTAMPVPVVHLLEIGYAL